MRNSKVNTYRKQNLSLYLLHVLRMDFMSKNSQRCPLCSLLRSLQRILAFHWRHKCRNDRVLSNRGCRTALLRQAARGGVRWRKGRGESPCNLRVSCVSQHVVGKEDHLDHACRVRCGRRRSTRTVLDSFGGIG